MKKEYNDSTIVSILYYLLHHNKNLTKQQEWALDDMAEKIKSFQEADQFILFSDEVIKVVKDYMGIGLFCQKPLVQDHYRQSSSPVFWHNSDCSMVAIAMPMRCGD